MENHDTCTLNLSLRGTILLSRLQTLDSERLWLNTYTKVSSAIAFVSQLLHTWTWDTLNHA